MGRRMARISEGYIRLVPATTQPGDCLWLLEGGNAPFILREEGKAMQLVGKAYINGIMTGEAFDKGKCQDMRIVQELPRILLEFLVFKRLHHS